MSKAKSLQPPQDGSRRVFQRLVEEHGAEVSERQLSRYVRARRRELGDVGEAFVSQHHERGAKAEVDARQEPVPIPRLCRDGFLCAPWDRPEMHLDPDVRRASSSWHLIPPETTERGLSALRADLESGRWDERHSDLRSLPELDVGLRLIASELASHR